MSTRIDILRAECESAGFTFDSWSPGDGVTRYRFFPAPGAGTSADPIKRTDYFASFGDYTALGWKEAVTYATGRVHGAGQAYAFVDDEAGYDPAGLRP